MLIPIFVFENSQRSYQLDGIKNWYQAVDGSWIWWCDANWLKNNKHDATKNLLIIRAQLKGDHDYADQSNENQTVADDNDSNTKVRDRRQQYRHQASYGNPKHWTETQTAYYKQCSNSLGLLKGLCFFDDYWQAYLVCCVL